MPPFLLKLILQFKLQIIVFLIVAGTVFVGYLWHVSAVDAAYARGVYTTDTTWVGRIARAPIETHTDTSWQWKTRKDTSGMGTAIASKLDSARRAFADSLLKYQNRDSVFYALTEKQSFSHPIKDDSSFSMKYASSWDPLNKAYLWGIYDVWVKQQVITNETSRLVPMPFKRFAVTASANAYGQIGFGFGYRLGTDADLFSNWNNYMVGLEYSPLGPAVGGTWWHPLQLRVTGFIK